MIEHFNYRRNSLQKDIFVYGRRINKNNRYLVKWKKNSLLVRRLYKENECK